MQRTPTVEEVRPARCPICEAVSSPVGGTLGLHGHGLRQRTVFGPPAPGKKPDMVDIQVRRYRCVACAAVLTVVPSSVQPRRRYSVAAIALALALWGLLVASAAEVRRQINPAKFTGPTAAGGWASLWRWARAVRQRELFPRTPLPPPSSTWREVAASAAAALAGQAAPDSRTRPIEHRAFEGAARAAEWA